MPYPLGQEARAEFPDFVLKNFAYCQNRPTVKKGQGGATGTGNTKTQPYPSPNTPRKKYTIRPHPHSNIFMPQSIKCVCLSACAVLFCQYKEHIHQATMRTWKLDTAVHKNWESHIDASHSRQPLVKGERLVRYEVNAVMHHML